MTVEALVALIIDCDLALEAIGPGDARYPAGLRRWIALLAAYEARVLAGEAVHGEETA